MIIQGTKRLTPSVTPVMVAATNTFVCTNLIVGKNVSMDGSTTVSYSTDPYGLSGELHHYPAGTHEKGTLIGVREWDTDKYLGQIEQAHRTYSVINSMNESQLAIGEMTFDEYPKPADTTGIIDYGSLIYLGLQRSRTAHEATKVMTNPVQGYGYYSNGESFTIADPNETQIMEMIDKGPGVCGTVWVAVRVPNDCISARVSQSHIHQFDMNDKNNCMYSPGVVSFAREEGYFDGVNKDFGFVNAYASLDFGARRYCETRVRSYFNMFTARGNEFLSYILGDTGAPMPLFVGPSRKISVQDIKSAVRGHYEGTSLNISGDFGVGPYHIPHRLSPLSFEVDDKGYFNKRSISIRQSGFVFITRMRSTLSGAIGGVLWSGMDDANMTVFTPVYCYMDKVPVCHSRVDGADYITFSWSSSFWIFNQVSDMVYPHYDLMAGGAHATRTRLETTFSETQEGIETAAAKLLERDPAKVKTFLTNYINMTTRSTFDTRKCLGEFMIMKYNDGVVKRMEDGKFGRNSIRRSVGMIRPGYPEEFLEEYVKQADDKYKTP